jgi:hypothetical protein
MDDLQLAENDQQGTLKSWLDKVTNYLTVFQFLFLVLSGSLGFFAVTRVQQSLDDQKFLQSITGYISDLKPVLDISCSNVVTPNGGLASRITIVNSGKNVVRLTKLSRQLVGTSDNAKLTPEAEMLPTSENGMEMDIAPGRSTYSGDGYAQRGWARDPNDIDLVVVAEAETSSAVMRVAKTILAKRIPEDELDAFSRASVKCRSGPAFTAPPVVPPVIPR